ncbi:hypothetical protein DLAC_11616 [Tieghemostelium lacteum]|uniref:Uncharacterized protein n=1 Tax=Tieghemostelium lacteum TaxID=361077 RepID=A0A151ZIZ1_TIELA|nr:hypothetical protein DLAC_11616 [Tieghemostelium lacteum]|eukprot:KYQ93814.1 hypothetical protein DLAC_11616 [Tieghemostelium lacteum]
MWLKTISARNSIQGLNLFWKPIKKNRYFVVEGYDKNYLLENDIKSPNKLLKLEEKEKDQPDLQPLQQFINDNRNSVVHQILIYSWKTLFSPTVPKDYKLVPSQRYRIKSTLKSFNPELIAVSTSYSDILNHWNQLNTQLFPVIKQIENTNDKVSKLYSYLDQQNNPESESKEIDEDEEDTDSK